MSKRVNDEMVKIRNASKAEKQKNKEAKAKKRSAALAAKAKARAEAEEKGLPWNDSIPAARFLEDYDSAFMSAVAGEPKVDEPVAEPVAATEQASTAELLKAAKEVLVSSANDNTVPEEPVTTPEEPVTEAAPTQTETSNDPSTWLVDTNGGLVRLPGESNTRYNKRKHKHKLWKRTEAEDTKALSKMYPTGELAYNSDVDGQTLPVPEKSAAESAAVFEAVTETVNEPATDTPAEEHGEQVGTEEVPQAEPATEAPAEEPAVQEEASATAMATEEPVVQAEVVVTPEKPVENNVRPTLTLASSQSADEALVARAQKFYGSTWNDERAEKLTKAFKFLEMAIRLQAKGESDSRINMPMTSAIRLETEAVGMSAATAKAA